VRRRTAFLQANTAWDETRPTDGDEHQIMRATVVGDVMQGYAPIFKHNMERFAVF
jgi:hypothetical protein